VGWKGVKGFSYLPGSGRKKGDLLRRMGRSIQTKMGVVWRCHLGGSVVFFFRGMWRF